MEKVEDLNFSAAVVDGVVELGAFLGGMRMDGAFLALSEAAGQGVPIMKGPGIPAIGERRPAQFGIGRRRISPTFLAGKNLGNADQTGENGNGNGLTGFPPATPGGLEVPLIRGQKEEKGVLPNFFIRLALDESSQVAHPEISMGMKMGPRHLATEMDRFALDDLLFTRVPGIESTGKERTPDGILDGSEALEEAGADLNLIPEAGNPFDLGVGQPIAKAGLQRLGHGAGAGNLQKTHPGGRADRSVFRVEPGF